MADQEKNIGQKMVEEIFKELFKREPFPGEIIPNKVYQVLKERYPNGMGEVEA